MKTSSLNSFNTNSKNNTYINNKSINNISQSNSNRNNNHKNQKYQINCNYNCNSKVSKLSSKNPYSINNENVEELNTIKNLWDDLGVSESYQEEFYKYINTISDEHEISDIFYYEKNNLIKLRESLIKLSTEISNRDNNIFKLKKNISFLESWLMEKNENLNSNIFDNIQNIIKYLRLHTVNIINQIGKIREISSYYELNGKWDLDRANRAYLYNSDYLLKMNNHIRFINDSILFKFFETDNGINKTDLFFSNIKYIITNDNIKLQIPISIELKNVINKCKYIIMQDKLFNNIKKDNMLNKQRNILSPKVRNKNNLLSKCQSEIYLVKDSDSKKYMTMFGHNKINLSRTLYYLKRTMGNNYEKMFLKNNKNLNDKKNMDIMDKYFNINRQNDKKMNINNNNKIVILF